MLTASCGFSSAGESAQSLMSSALGTGTTEAVTQDTEPAERTAAATVWRIDASAKYEADRLDSITAVNGVTVRVEVPDPAGEAESSGPPLDKVHRLVVVDASGNVAWTTAAGGVVASDLGLVDFDGRYVLLDRAPPEPVRATDPTQHIVYDLDCRTVDAVDCTHDFWATPGTAALTANERPEGMNELNVQLMTLCPSAGRQFITPSELTPDQAAAYQQAAAVLATCDSAGIALDPAELAYQPSQGLSGWRWTEFAEALGGPYRSSSLETLVWGPTPAGSTVQVGVSDPDNMLVFSAAEQEPSGSVSVTLGQSHLVLTGSIAEEIAAQVAMGASEIAEKRGRQLVDRLTFDGPAAPSASVDRLLAAMSDELDQPSTVAGNVHLTAAAQVQQWASVGVGPTTDELAAVEAFTAFAAGDIGAFVGVPLADDVVLAAGERVVASRSRSALRDRWAWRLDLGSLGDAPGPFNILNQARGQKDVTVGALHGCDETAPDPAPAELAGLRRLSLQPDQRLIQSCRQWSNVDLYFDDSGLIVGVGLNLFSR